MNKKQMPEVEDDLDLTSIYGKVEEDEDYTTNENIKPVEAVVTNKKTVSFEEPITDEPKREVKKEREFIRRDVIIDTFCIKRKRVELTPSVCNICAFDVAEKYFGSWHQVPASERETIKQAVVEHKKAVHTMADSHIIKESEMPTKWLGGGRL